MNNLTQTLLKRDKKGLYGLTQCQMCYHSNHVENNALTEEQITSILKTGTLPASDIQYCLKDIQETAGHFLMFDEMLNTYEEPLSSELLKKYHFIFRNSILDDHLNNGQIGEFREHTEESVADLLSWYQTQDISLYTLAEFCLKFETIYPFQTGGRQVLKIILFKECLKNQLTPFIIRDSSEQLYFQILELTDGFEELKGLFTEEQTAYSLKNVRLTSGKISAPVSRSVSLAKSAVQHSKDAQGEFIRESSSIFKKGQQPGFYNYCPSAFEKDGIIYTYFCTNTQPYIIVDSIALVKSIPNPSGNGYLHTDAKIVLSAGKNPQWDSMHVCDPSVIEGDFQYNGKHYNYLMGYLGCTSLDNQDNQIGIAVSNDLENWHKINENPFIKFTHDNTHSAFQWGVGQVSMINLDKKGKIAFFYTSGTHNLTSEKLSVIELSNLNAPVVLREATVPNKVTINRQGYLDFISNADFAYRDGILYMVCDTHPFADEIYENGKLIRTETSITPERSSIYSMPVNLDDLNWGVWTRTGVLNRETTGYDRNHNCGFLRDPYGYLPAGAISVMYTGAKGKADGVAPFCRLWSYTIYTHQLDTQAK